MHTPFLRAAVHRLAQPLTAALWLNELKPSGSTHHSLERELRRAAGILGFLRELSEEREQSRACALVPVAELLANRLAEARHGADARQSGLIMRGLLCWAEPASLDRVLDSILKTAARASQRRGAIKVSIRPREDGYAGFRFTAPCSQGKRLAEEFLRDAHPFEHREFPFESRELPEAARIQALVEGMGGSLGVEGGPATLTFLLRLKCGPSDPASESKSNQRIQ